MESLKATQPAHLRIITILMDMQRRRRRRPALSCYNCRRRKVKCDRNIPSCTQCISAKATCDYNTDINYDSRQAQQPERMRRGNSDDVVSAPLIQETTAESSCGDFPYSRGPAAGAVAVLRPIVTGDDVPRNSRMARSHDIPSDLPNASGTPTDIDVKDLLRRIQQLEASNARSNRHGGPTTTGDILAHQSGLKDSQIILNKTRILRWSHWVGTADEFEPVVACFLEAEGQGDKSSYQHTEIKPLLSQIHELLLKCKQVARGMKVGRPSRGLLHHGVGLAQIPSREVADTMTALYFKSFESTHRILHVPTFWAEYQEYWDHPDSITGDIRLKILLVIGIGSSLCSGQRDSDIGGLRKLARQWVYAAQTWLSGPLEKDRLTISGLQIYCLTILARQIFSIGGDLVWMSVGSLLHRAMQMGLHRDPTHFPAVSVLQAEIRRRLWATILELAIQSSLDSAMPPRIYLNEFDAKPPANLNDEDMDESTVETQPHPKDKFTMASMQLILLDSLPIRLRILQLLNGLHYQVSYTEILALSSELTDAYRTSCKSMKEHEGSGVTPFDRNLLVYLVRRFLIPLHCLFSSQARNNPLFHYSRKVCVDVAQALIQPEPDEGFSSLLAIGGGFFREGIRYAQTIIGAELISETETQRLDGTLHSATQHRDHLKKAMETMLALSMDRIQQGESNVKGYMFLVMIMAYVEAIEAGTEYEMKVAESTRDSLVACHEVLLAQASALPSPSPENFSPDFTFPGIYGGSDDYGMDIDFGLFTPDVGFM